KARAAIETMASDIANERGQLKKAQGPPGGASSGHHVDAEDEAFGWKQAWKLGMPQTAEKNSTAASDQAISTNILSHISQDRHGLSMADLHGELEKQHPGLTVEQMHGVLKELRAQDKIQFDPITRVAWD